MTRREPKIRKRGTRTSPKRAKAAVVPLSVSDALPDEVRADVLRGFRDQGAMRAVLRDHGALATEIVIYALWLLATQA